jgi:hypothetical protein
MKSPLTSLFGYVILTLQFDFWKGILMKKTIAFLLCLFITVALISCNYNDGNNTDPSVDDPADTTLVSPDDHTTEQEKDTAEQPFANESFQNQLALQAYGKAIRNEIPVYYTLLYSDMPGETYFEMIRRLEKGIPTGQTLIDMDKDGIKELILSYDHFFIFLCFKNDKVYGSDVKLDSMNTIYTDGSFSWSNYDDIFGYECGISRVSFVNGIKKVEELCRAENHSKFFISGVRVTKDQYDNYLEENEKIPVVFTDFDMTFLDGNELFDNNELKAIKIASEYWGIEDGDFDPERGLRYRVICKRKIDERWYEVSLYHFVYNSYYEHLEIATVNIETKEIKITKYPDGRG